MKLYPFIATEKAADRQVHKPCGLLGVSRSACYQWSQQKPSVRAREDNALREQVVGIHRGNRGTYGALRVHQQLRQQGVRCSKRRVARLMAKEGLCGRQRRRARRTTIADPGAQPFASDLLQPSFTPSAFTIDQVWVGDISYVRTWTAGATWRRSSTSPAAGSWASRLPTTCERASSAMPCAWPLPPGIQLPDSSFIVIAAANTPRQTTASSCSSTASASPGAALGSVGITRASSRPSRLSSSTVSPWPPAPLHGSLSSSTSRYSIVARQAQAHPFSPWAIAPPSTTRKPCPQPGPPPRRLRQPARLTDPTPLTASTYGVVVPIALARSTSRKAKGACSLRRNRT